MIELSSNGATSFCDTMLDPETERLLGAVLLKKDTASLAKLLEGYRLSARSEGKSGNTIAIVEASVRYLNDFLVANNLSTNVCDIGLEVLRGFILYLKERPRFANHRFTRPQDGHLE